MSMTDRDADYDRIEAKLAEASERVDGIHRALGDMARRLRS